MVGIGVGRVTVVGVFGVQVGLGVVGEMVGYGGVRLEVGLGGHLSVVFVLAPQLPPIKTVSDDPNSPPLPSSLPFT